MPASLSLARGSRRLSGFKRLSSREIALLGDRRALAQLPLLASLLPLSPATRDVLAAENAETRCLAPHERAQATRALLARLVGARVRAQPCALLVDDAHHMHPGGGA